MEALLFLVVIYFLPTIINCFNKSISLSNKVYFFLYNLLAAWAIIPWFMMVHAVSTDLSNQQEQKKSLEQQIQWGQQKEKEQIEHKEKLLAQNKELKTEDIVLNENLNTQDKITLLQEMHGYSLEEAEELCNTAIKVAKKAKLTKIKTEIFKKAYELYGNIPTDEERKPISDEVKLFVWQRDKGKCVKCGSNENLEFDHIIPLSKGGNNTARNIQILCEKCNRSKKDNIV